LLTRSDPARAEEMLGHLIQYLRHSLPRTQDELSTLGAELERALAYLEILKIRMGPRLSVQTDVPENLRATPLPSMMLQTLVENAIKHGWSRAPAAAMSGSARAATMAWWRSPWPTTAKASIPRPAAPA
jgi:LytS/YehU family sensor histidine kinase